MDSGHIILSAVQPETVGARIDKNIEDIVGKTKEMSKQKNEKKESE